MGAHALPLAGLDGEEVLRVWEASAAAQPVCRSAAILTEALPDLPVDALDLPLGRCDTLLLALRVGTFGSPISGVTSCPQCGADVDIDADAGAILASLPAAQLDYDKEYIAEFDQHVLHYRLPTPADLVAVAGSEDPATGIARRCIWSQTRGGGPIAFTELPAEVIARTAERMSEADPAADIRFSVCCPECATTWSAPLDVAAVFEVELTGAAMRILGEIDELARRYGWSEQQILALSPVRRQTYMRLR